MSGADPGILERGGGGCQGPRIGMSVVNFILTSTKKPPGLGGGYLLTPLGPALLIIRLLVNFDK